MERASILDYRGNAGLAAGSGSDNGILELGELDFSPSTRALDNLAQRANQVKDLEYRQKLRDRDTLYEKLATMQVDLDKALPEHQQMLRDKRDEIKNSYISNPDILSNPKAYAEMQAKLSEFNELNAYTKTNYATTTKDLLEASKIEDPDDRAARMKHINEQRNKLKENPYELYEPYAAPLKWSYDKMFKPVKPTETVTGTDKDGNVIVRSVTDPNEMMKNYEFDVVEGNDKSVANQIDEWMKNYGQMKTPQERKNDIASWNNKIAAANKLIKDPTKRIKTVELGEDGLPVFSDDYTKDDFAKAAYVAMRFQSGTSTRPPTKEELAALKNKADIAHLANQDSVARMRANSDKVYKGAMAAAAGKKASAYASHMKAQVKKLATAEEQDALLDEMYKRNLVQQPTLIKGMGNGRVRMADIPAENSLPIFTLKGGSPETLIPIDGKPVYAPEDKKKEKPLYYKDGHYEPVYMFNGKKVDHPELTSMYKKFKTVASGRGEEWKGSFDDWIKKAVDENAMEFLIKGANGTTDRKLSLAAQRIIANKTTKKGQDGAFEQAPVDEQVMDDAPE